MLESLHLRHFRSYEELNFRPGEGFTVLAGPNGAGKSNLLEGIHYLGAGFPYRQAQDEALVRWGADFFVIRGRVLQNGLNYDLEIAYQLETRRKITRINGKRDLSGTCATYLPVVVFSPADLLLIQGAPSLRRRFLDLVVTQVRPQHAADLHDYAGILTQRNNLLRQGFCQRAEIDPWDEQLVAVGARIISRRLSVFQVLLGLARTAFASLSRSGELDGAYISQVVPPRPVDAVEADEGFCRRAFAAALERRRGLDERLRVTTTGPHRDDLCFYLAGHQAQVYCSQGEQRLIALSLKLAQSRLLSGATPVSGAAPAAPDQDPQNGAPSAVAPVVSQAASQQVAPQAAAPSGASSGSHQEGESSVPPPAARAGSRPRQTTETLLLLDDVFSELDAVHRDRVLLELARSRQVIATTTSFPGGGQVPAGQLTPEIAVYRASSPERLAQ